MHPQACHAGQPGARHRLRHQPAAMALAGKLGHQPEIGELTGAGVAEVELEQADLDPGAVDDRMDLHLRIVDDRGKRRIVHRQPRIP